MSVTMVRQVVILDDSGAARNEISARNQRGDPLLAASSWCQPDTLASVTVFRGHQH